MPTLKYGQIRSSNSGELLNSLEKKDIFLSRSDSYHAGFFRTFPYGLVHLRFSQIWILWRTCHLVLHFLTVSSLFSLSRFPIESFLFDKNRKIETFISSLPPVLFDKKDWEKGKCGKGEETENKGKRRACSDWLSPVPSTRSPTDKKKKEFKS